MENRIATVGVILPKIMHLCIVAVLVVTVAAEGICSFMVTVHIRSFSLRLPLKK